MYSNPCIAKCILKKLGRKVVNKNVSQGYIKVKRDIMKNSQLSYVSIQPNFEKIICQRKKISAKKQYLQYNIKKAFII